MKPYIKIRDCKTPKMDSRDDSKSDTYVGCTGETAVGDECNVLAQAGTHDGSSRFH